MLVCALTLYGLQASAAAQALGPITMVRETVGQMFQAVTNRSISSEERQSRMLDAISNHFDFSDTPRSLLGYHWRELNSDERQQLMPALNAFLTSAYARVIKHYVGEGLQILDETSDGHGYSTVRTSFQPGDGDAPVRVDYHLRQESGDWKIYDVAVDNVSISAKYRTELERAMSAGGFDGLIRDIQSRTTMTTSLAR
ncbi:MAG TPA: ABC transporter substrate-binding protein [Candidatus Binataceae bacterium]|nr:ABC transporter substrate-binding protein [Candidatus Binataceae bacterium]